MKSSYGRVLVSVCAAVSVISGVLPIPALRSEAHAEPATPASVGYAETVPVGRISASAGVDAQGHATYSIPLEVPANRGNLLPTLSLEYNSGGGLGTYGEGWTLSGIPMLSYCHHAQGTYGWCYNGDPLVPVEWPEDEWYPDGAAPAVRFRTHPDKSIRATLATVEDAPGHDIDGWLIEHPDGTQAHFQFDRESGDLAVTPYRISDRSGNYVELEGFADFPDFEDEAHLLYTGNLRTAAEPTRELVIREDAIILPGRYYKLDVQRGVSCAEWGTVGCLDQDGPAGAADQLTSITLCEGHPDDSTPGICLPPTRFDYAINTPELGEGYGAYPPSLHIPNDPCHGPIFADFDGNGITDVLWGEGEQDDDGECEKEEVSIYLRPRPAVGASGTTVAGLATVPAGSQILTVDVDADGRTDVVFADSESSELHTFRRIGSSSGLEHDILPVSDSVGIIGWAVADLDRNGSQDLVLCAEQDAKNITQNVLLGGAGELRAYRGVVDQEGVVFTWDEEPLWSAHNPESSVSRSCLESNYKSIQTPAGGQVRIGRLEDQEQTISPEPGQSATIEVPRGAVVYGADGSFLFAADDSGEYRSDGFFDIVAPPSIDGSIRALRLPLHDDPDGHFNFGGTWSIVGNPCHEGLPDPLTQLYEDSCPQYEFSPGWDTFAELARHEYRPTAEALAEPLSSLPLELQRNFYAKNTLAGGGLSLAPIDADITDDESDGIAELGSSARDAFFFDWNYDGFQDLLYPVFEPGKTEGHWEVSLWDSTGQTLGADEEVIDASGAFAQATSTEIPAWDDGRKRLFVVEQDGLPGSELAVLEEGGHLGTHSLLRGWQRSSLVEPPRLLERVEDGFGREMRYQYSTAYHLTLEDPECGVSGMKTLGDGAGPLVRCEVPDEMLVSQIYEETDDDGDRSSRYRYQGAYRDLGSNNFRGFERTIEEEIRGVGTNPDRMVHVSEVTWADVEHATPGGDQGPFEATNLGVGLPSLPRYSLSLSITDGQPRDATATEYKWTELPDGSRIYAETSTETVYGSFQHSPTAYVDVDNPTLDQVKASFLEEYRSEIRREQVDEFGNVGVETTTAGIGAEALSTTTHRVFSPSFRGNLQGYAYEIDQSVNSPGFTLHALWWDPNRVSSQTVVDDDDVSRTTTFEYYEDNPTPPACVEAPNWPFACPPDVNLPAPTPRAIVVEPGTSDEVRTEFSYSQLGSVLQTRQTAAGVSGARGTRTLFADDEELFPSAVYNAFGHTQTTEWDEILGVPNVSTNPRGVRTEVQTDGLGRPVRTTVFGRDGMQLLASSEISRERMQPNDADGQNASPSRLRVRTRVAGGGWSEVEYGGNGFPLVIRRPVSPSTAPSIEEYVYSSMAPGQVLRAYVPRFEGAGGVTTAYEYHYDARGRVTDVTDPVGNLTLTQHGFRELRLVDAAVEPSSRKFDSLGRVIETVDEAGTRVCFSYDARSNVDLVTRGCGTLPAEQAVTDYDYDEFGRIVMFDDPASGRTDMSYTALGELEFVLNGNEEDTYYTYDSLGRVSFRVAKNGYEQYFYDAPPEHPDLPDAVKSSKGTPGLLVGITGKEHSRWMVRDEFDRVVNEFDVFGGETYQQDYQFDGYGRIERATFPSPNDDGVRQHFQYDALGNVGSVDVSAGSKYFNVWEAQARDASGRIVLEKKGDVVFDRLYDELGVSDQATATPRSGPLTGEPRAIRGLARARLARAAIPVAASSSTEAGHRLDRVGDRGVG